MVRDYYSKYRRYKQKYLLLKGGNEDVSNDTLVPIIVDSINDSTNNNKKPGKILVIDFDNTITRMNMPAQLFHKHEEGITDIYEAARQIMMEYGLRHIFSALFNDINFVNYLKKQKQDNGFIYVVASFGFKEPIKMLLTEKKLIDLFDHIYTPADFGLTEGFNQIKILDGKNKMIEEIKKKYNPEIKNQDVMLIDDYEYNIMAADREGYRFLQPNAETGLVGTDMKVIEEFLGGATVVDSVSNQQ